MSLLSFIALELTPAAVVVGNAGTEERSLLLGADGEVIAAPAVPRRADVEASAFALLISFDAAGSAGLDLSGRLGVVGKLFGFMQLVGETTMIDLIGPMRVIRGDALTLRLTVTNDADEREDLTDAEIELQVRASVGAAGDPLIRKVVGTGITLLAQGDDTLGQADIEITTADTDRAPALLWLDVVVTLSGKRQHVVAPRKFTIAGTVTPVS